MPRKLTVKTDGKSYLHTESVLYSLASKQKLAKVLGFDLKRLKELMDNSSYNSFINTKGGGGRSIQEPLSDLKIIHTRIASLLSRIKQPTYVHSGIKGRSHITNAKEHLGSHRLLTTDLKKFFPSTTRQMVFSFFLKKMKCSPDVSDLLSHLCTFNDFIPTGSQLSMPLAFWANEDMFNTLYKVAAIKNIKMTLFVDDVTFSGILINKKFKSKIKKIIANYGHIMHPTKTKIFNADKPKLVTGVILVGDETRVRNANHQKIYQDMIQLLAIPNNKQILSLNRRLLGRVQAQGMIDYRFKDKARSLQQRLTLSPKNSLSST